MTYLPLAGLTSIIDAVGMPIFEHGFGAVAKNAMRVVDGDFAQMRLNGKQVRYAMKLWKYLNLLFNTEC